MEGLTQLLGILKEYPAVFTLVVCFVVFALAIWFKSRKVDIDDITSISKTLADQFRTQSEQFKAQSDLVKSLSEQMSELHEQNMHLMEELRKANTKIAELEASLAAYQKALPSPDAEDAT